MVSSERLEARGGERGTLALVGIGSNLDSVVGDRVETIASAVARLDRTESVRVLAVAGAIETAPWTPPGVVIEQGPYLNSAALVETALGARGLLGVLLSIEAAHGRDRSAGPRWGARTLDLDLLVYGDEEIDEHGLVVPHPRLVERRFVLEPCAAVAPGIAIPGAGLTVVEALERLGDNS